MDKVEMAERREAGKNCSTILGEGLGLVQNQYPMFPPRSLLIVTASAFFALSQLATAAPHTYQVTGPILELTDTSITVQKGAEKWEIARDASAKVTGELK